MMPSCLVFSSGGARGIAHFGAIDVLRRRGMLANVKCCVGSSAGAIAAAAVALGVHPRLVMREALRRYPPPGLKATFENWESGFGVSSDAVMDWAIDVALGARADIRLGDVLGVHGIRLVLATSDVASAKTVYLTGSTHPTLALREALKMSCAIPFVFGARRLGNMVLVDGAMTDYFPLARGIEEAHGGDVLGVCLDTATATDAIDETPTSTTKTTTTVPPLYGDVVAFAIALISCAVQNQRGRVCTSDGAARAVVRVLFPAGDLTTLSASQDWMRDAFVRGARATKLQLTLNQR